MFRVSMSAILVLMRMWRKTRFLFDFLFQTRVIDLSILLFVSFFSFSFDQVLDSCISLETGRTPAAGSSFCRFKPNWKSWIYAAGFCGRVMKLRHQRRHHHLHHGTRIAIHCTGNKLLSSSHLLWIIQTFSSWPAMAEEKVRVCVDLLHTSAAAAGPE
jgi:hypothetical protein